MKKILNWFYFTLVFTLGLGVVSAQEPPRFEEIGGVLDSAFSYIVPFGGLLATGMLVYGGYMWLASGGDPGKVKQAQGALTWAIAGIVFLTIFGMILQGIFDFLGN